ncbi:hypothetical protein JCM10207_001815 [Rhodosporidiobolus poonsookiae]
MARKRTKRDPPSASWSTLPPELKLRVAQLIQLSDHNDFATTAERHEFYEQGKPDVYLLESDIYEQYLREGRRTTKDLAALANRIFAWVAPSRSGLTALSLVNREINEHLQLRDRESESLLTCIRDVLPRQAHLVRFISYNPQSSIDADDVDELDIQELDPSERVVMRAAERMVGVPALRRLYHRRIRTPTLLLSEILKRCPNYTELMLAPYNPFDYGDEDGDWPRQQEFLDHASLAAIAAAPRLTFLAFTFNAQVEIVTGTMRKLLQATSNNLVKLRIVDDEIPGSPSEPSYLALFETIAELPHLQDLTLGNLLLPDEFLLQRSFAWSLHTLTLCACSVSSYPALARLISHTHDTLSTLSLTGLLDEEPFLRSKASIPPVPTTLDLPHLTHLTFGTLTAAPLVLLDHLASPSIPITTFKLDDFPAHTDENSAGPDLPRLMAFFAAHASTLRAFTSAEQQGSLNRAEVRAVGAWCAAQNPRVRYSVPTFLGTLDHFELKRMAEEIMAAYPAGPEDEDEDFEDEDDEDYDPPSQSEPDTDWKTSGSEEEEGDGDEEDEWEDTESGEGEEAGGES